MSVSGSAFVTARNGRRDNPRHRAHLERSGKGPVEPSVSPLRRTSTVPDRYNDFVHRENIAEFLAKLNVETDPAKRAILRTLLAEERAYLLPVPKAPGP